jgi:serine/threonine protein kinase
MSSLGKYTLIQQLGTGSMGTVYLARDSVLDREVALKTIKTGLDVEAEMKERFYREARTCARLQHPSIVTIFDLGEQDNFAYIAMELLAGSDFRKIIEGRSPVDLSVKIEAIIQVCEALAYAHQQGIVHRDVKPSNLFLSLDNRAKVLDFGIARLPSSRLTVVGRVLGTPNYMAPEQILGKRSDGRSDLFSIAVVFFELLVCQHPFRSPLIPRRIVDGEPDSIFDHDSSLPLPLERVFARGLAKDPEQRYATGDEFASDLRAILDGVRQNSSPRFSHFALPSLRAPVAVKPADTPIFNSSDSRTPEERQLSGFLRLLPEFESAVERGNRIDAETALRQLQLIAGHDKRFDESLRTCTSKMNGVAPGSSGLSPLPMASPSVTDQSPPVSGNKFLEDDLQGESFTHWLQGAISATEAEAVGSTDQSINHEPADVVCIMCGAKNRRDASFCIGCGGQMRSPDASNAPSKSSMSARVGQVSKPLGPSTVKLKAIIAACASSGSGFQLKARRLWDEFSKRVPGVKGRESRILVAGLLACIGLVLILDLYLGGRSIPVENHVASGHIASGTPLYRERTGSQTILPLRKGTQLNLLKVPDYASQQRLQVQPIVDGKALASGYVVPNVVRDWNTESSKVAMALARFTGPSQDRTDADLEVQIDKFRALVTRFPNTDEARVAALEEAGLDLEMSRREKSEGRPEAEWRNWAEHALSLVGGVSDSQAVGISGEANSIIGSARPGGAQGNSGAAGSSGAGAVMHDPVQDAADIQELKMARDLESKYDHDGALRAVNHYLLRHPDDGAAHNLKKKIQEVKQVEEDTLR